MSNNSSSTSHLGNVLQGRNTSLALNLPSMQSVTVPPNLKSEVVIIPSTSTPNRGSYFIFDVKGRNYIISDIVLNFNISAISGLAGTVTSYPHFSPASFFTRKIVIVVKNVTIDTLYALSNFVSQQVFNDDQDRVYINDMQGAYNSLIQRNTLSTATSKYYIKLRTIYNECHLPILSDSHNLQIRVNMETLANVDIYSTLTLGTLAATIKNFNIIVKVLKLPNEIATKRLNAMIEKPEQSFYINSRYSPFAFSSGVSSTAIVFTSFGSDIAAIFFAVRPSTKITLNDAYQFTAITNFAILDSTSSNCVGGQNIPSFLALNYLNQFYCRSSYTSETLLGANIAGTVTDNKANVYGWSFSSNICEAHENGLLLGHRKFLGNEQLQLTFTASLSAGVQVDIWAFSQSVFEQGSTYVKVKAL